MDSINSPQVKKTIFKMLIIGFIFLPGVVWADITPIPATTYYGSRVVNVDDFPDYFFFVCNSMSIIKKESNYTVPGKSDCSTVKAVKKQDYNNLPLPYIERRAQLRILLANGPYIASRNPLQHPQKSPEDRTDESVLNVYEVVNFSEEGFDLKKIKTIRIRYGPDGEVVTPAISGIVKDLSIPMIVGLFLGLVIGLIIVAINHKKNKINRMEW